MFLMQLPALIILVLRIGVPIYLYQEAKQRRFPVTWLWIVFGIFEPIMAVMLYYVLVYLIKEIKK